MINQKYNDETGFLLNLCVSEYTSYRYLGHINEKTMEGEKEKSALVGAEKKG